MAEQIMEANQKADMLVNQLKQLNLSPFEKFLIVHDFCASKPYQANGVEDYNDFNNAMTTDKIVCFGYAEIMKYMCNALGIECELFYCDLPPMAMKHGMHTKGHVINLVRIKDEKYGIDDYYVSDASSDSSEYFSKKGLICYAFAALPLQDLKCGIYDYTYPFIVPREYPQQTKQPISEKTFSDALNNAYAGLNGYDIEQNNNKKSVKNKFVGFLFKKYATSNDKDAYEKWQNGEVLDDKVFERKFYTKRIEESIKLTKETLSKFLAKKRKEALSCFYDAKLKKQQEKEN